MIINICIGGLDTFKIIYKGINDIFLLVEHNTISTFNLDNYVPLPMLVGPLIEIFCIFVTFSQPHTFGPLTPI